MNKFIRLYKYEPGSKLGEPVLINIQHIAKITKSSENRCMIWISTATGYDVEEYNISFDDLDIALPRIPWLEFFN